MLWWCHDYAMLAHNSENSLIRNLSKMFYISKTTKGLGVIIVPSTVSSFVIFIESNFYYSKSNFYYSKGCTDRELQSNYCSKYHFFKILKSGKNRKIFNIALTFILDILKSLICTFRQSSETWPYIVSKFLNDVIVREHDWLIILVKFKNIEESNINRKEFIRKIL